MPLYFFVGLKIKVRCANMISYLIKSMGVNWIFLLNARVVRADFFAGFTGAAVVLPQAIAFSSIAGLPPEFGFYTAIITTIIAAIFGSSLVMVSGPTTAISILVFSAISPLAPFGSARFIEIAILLSFLVGIWQILFAIFRVALVANFISHTIILGFTSAAAFHIFLSQVAPAFGLEKSSVKFSTFPESLFDGLSEGTRIAIISTVLTIALMFLMRRIFPRIPPFLPVLILGSFIVFALGGSSKNLPFVQLVSVGTPAFALPNIGLIFDWHVFKSGFLIALIGTFEAIAIGRTLGYRSNTVFSANKETFGQGLSNIVGSLFQCYPGSGSFTRSAFNTEAGAKTPLAAIVSSLCLIFFICFFSQAFVFIPLNVIAGLIIYIAVRLIDFSEISKVFDGDWIGIFSFLGTLFFGMFISLEFSIFIGVLIFQTMKLIKGRFL